MVKTAKRKRLKLDGTDNVELVEEEDKSTRKLSESKLPRVGTEVGFSVAVPIVGGVLLGVYLDNKLNASPKLTLSFLFLGLLVGFINIYKIVNDNKKQ